MPLKRLLLLAAVGALLAGCSSTGHKEEVTTEAGFPASESTTSNEAPTTTTRRKLDLNTKSGSIYHIKEHGTIPDFYLNVFGAGASENDDGPTSYEVNATTLKKGGAVACENEQILNDAKYLLAHGDSAFEELVPDLDESDRKYAPVYEKLEMSAASPILD